MNNSQRIDTMTAILTEAFTPKSLDIIDDSHKHIGHKGAATGLGHFTVKINAPTLHAKSRIQAHQAIYEALGDLMRTDIHALSIVLTQ